MVGLALAAEVRATRVVAVRAESLHRVVEAAAAPAFIEILTTNFAGKCIIRHLEPSPHKRHRLPALGRSPPRSYCM